MNDSQVESTNPKSDANEKTPVPWVPKKTIIFTAVVLAIIFTLPLFLSELDDWFGMGKDIVVMISIGLFGLIIAVWMSNILFFNKWSILSRVVGAAIIVVVIPALVYVANPVSDGDVAFDRFEPMWMKHPELQVVKNDADENVDLGKETEFDFPKFLGTNQNANIQNSIELNEKKFSESKLMWRKPIGRGWSGFTARNGFAVTMEQRGKYECVTCYEVETGELRWIYEHEARHQDQMNLGKVGPRSTPTIHQGKVYAMGAVGNLVCLDGKDGSVIWQKDVNPILGIQLKTDKDRSGMEIQWEENTTLAWGRSGSPLIVGDQVIVAGGGPNTEDKKPTTLLSFNANTGELNWKGGDKMIAYGSPILATVATVSQILLVGENDAMGFNPETGEMMWSFPRPGQSNGAANCSQVTVLSDNYILTSKGYPDGCGELIALDIEKKGLVPKSILKMPGVLKTKFSNPIIIDGHSYAISNGFLECVSMADGKRVWKNRNRLGNGQLLKVGNLLLAHAEKGKIYLIEPSSDGYVERGSFSTVDGLCWNNLCLYGPYLLLRSELEMACFELPTVSPAF